MLHIYTAKLQPATDFVYSCGEIEIRSGIEPDKLLYCHCCGKRRPAKDCVVQCYYDGTSVWCAPEKGCKDPQEIAEKRARAFANRSAGQKARWAKASAV